MNIEEKIVNFLKEQPEIQDLKLGKIKISENPNKKGENLLYIKTTNFEKEFGNCYINEAKYYSFNQNGDYVACVNVKVKNVIPPDKIELEYETEEKFRNQGNVTVLAQEVIKETFEEMTFDGLKVRKNFPESNINSIVLAISSTNYASLAVAKKLGFENGILTKEDYYNSKEKSSNTK